MGLALVLAGCAQTVQERVRELNDDGVRLYRTGAYVQACQSFQDALDLKPGDANLQFNIGQCHDHLREPAKAEAAYRLCLQASPNHAECRHALALLMWQQDRRQETTRMIEDWLGNQPNLAAAQAENGWLWHQLGDVPRARARLVLALRLDPHNNLALTELAQIYEGLDRLDRAAYLYQQVLKYHPEQPDIVFRLSALKAQGAGPPKPD
jgi:tetratricopeptide (TPR) repeat protein